VYVFGAAALCAPEALGKKARSGEVVVCSGVKSQFSVAAPVPKLTVWIVTAASVVVRLLPSTTSLMIAVCWELEPEAMDINTLIKLVGSLAVVRPGLISESPRVDQPSLGPISPRKAVFVEFCSYS
jgi:hypothetical protein